MIERVRAKVHEVLLWEAARDGILLWESAPGTWAAFQAEAALDHADFAATTAATLTSAGDG